MDTRFWEDFTSFDFSKSDLTNSVAILPVAAVEQHGPHLPLSVDSKIINTMVKKIIRGLPAESKAIFLPTQKIGKSNEHLLFAGTLSLSTETFYGTLLDIGRCVCSTGIKKLIFLNSHGGNISILDTAARELRVRHHMLVFNVNWFGVGMPEGIFRDSELKHGIHAGDVETSLMLAIDKENVRLNRAKNFVPKTVEIEKEYSHIGLQAAAKFGWQSQDLNENGACGNAEIATAEKGRITLEHVCNKLLQVIKEIEQFPLNTVTNKIGF